MKGLIEFQLDLWDKFQAITSAPSGAKRAFMDAVEKQREWDAKLFDECNEPESGDFLRNQS